MIKYIYIAGPYTLPDKEVNVKKAIEVANEVWEAGYFPYLPHLNHYWDLQTPHDYEDWLALDAEWLKQCDALIRIPGLSEGADYEVSLAEELGIPVYYSLDEMINSGEGVKTIRLDEEE